MKQIILIPDSFKGTMSSTEICELMSGAIRTAYPRVKLTSIPVADGGEGSVDAFLTAMGGEKVYCLVQGPYGKPVNAFYGRIGDVAVIEMAAAAGLPLVGDDRRVADTTTYGVGQLMRAAIDAGAKKLVVGLGGSSTNDGGCGAAAAMGVRFYDRTGHSFVPVGATLSDIDSISADRLYTKEKDVQIVTMCDIDNPLCGAQGAAAVFGPQKGATAEMVTMLDAGLAHLAWVAKRDLNADILHMPGAGAAGGMGGGMVAFFSSELQMGIETVLDTVGFDQLLADASLVLTGEGRIDGQSLRGKVVVGVARRAKKAKVPVFAVVGDIGDGSEAAYLEGVTGIFSINRVAVPYSQAKLRAREDLRLTVENLMRTLAAFGVILS